MAFDCLENSALVQSVESHAHHFVQDIKDYFLPHHAADLMGKSASSDRTLGGILPACDISFDDSDISAHSGQAADAHKGGGMVTHEVKPEYAQSGGQSINAYDSRIGVETAPAVDPIFNDMNALAARATLMNQEKDQFIKMEKSY